MMNKVEGGFTSEKGVHIHNVLNSTRHTYKASYSLLFRQTDKKQQGCGDRIQLCITFTAYRYTHSLAHILIFQTGKPMKGRRKEAALHV